MDNQSHRATIRFDNELYKETRKLAVDLHKDMQTVVAEAVAAYLPVMRKEVNHRKKPTVLKTYKMGNFEGLTREKIYED